MIVTRGIHLHKNRVLKIENYCFKKVESFLFLRVEINSHNSYRE